MNFERSLVSARACPGSCEFSPFQFPDLGLSALHRLACKGEDWLLIYLPDLRVCDEPVLLQLVMRVSQVSAGLFLTDLDSALNVSVLSSRNVTLIVNACGLECVSYPQLDGLQVLHVPVQDQPHAPLREYFDLVAEQINQNQTGATLVHCTAGRSRSPALIMAYLMRSEGLSLRRAYELVLERRPFIRPNAGFWRQLMDYERSLFGRTTMRMARTSGGVLPEALQDSDSAVESCLNI